MAMGLFSGGLEGWETLSAGASTAARRLADKLNPNHLGNTLRGDQYRGCPFELLRYDPNNEEILRTDAFYTLVKRGQDWKIGVISVPSAIPLLAVSQSLEAEQ